MTMKEPWKFQTNNTRYSISSGYIFSARKKSTKKNGLKKNRLVKKRENVGPKKEKKRKERTDS